MATNIQNLKNVVRQEVKQTLSYMCIEEKHLQSNYVAEKLIQHRKYLEATRIGIYLSLPDEIQTESILKHMFSIGKLCFIPRYNAESMDMILMESFEERDTIPKTKWNIRQSTENFHREDATRTGGLDILIIPGRAFTKSGYRLGRGKGYYDKYLNRYKEKFDGKLPYMIGLAYTQQIYEELPITETDRKLNEVLFDNREKSIPCL